MECNVCAEAFDKNERLPKVVVPCVHSACLKCLQEMDRKMCPTCGEPFLGDPVRLPNNYTVLQMLQNSVDTPRGWCSECCALAAPRCWVQHLVLAVGAALGQRVRDVLPQAGAQLDGLKERREEERATQALANLAALTGESWTLTLRGARRSLSVPLGNADDPVTKALLLLVAVRGELVEVPQKDADKEGGDSTAHIVDDEETIFSSPRTKDRAGLSGREANTELISKPCGGDADQEGGDSTARIVDVEETIFSSPRTTDRAGRDANTELISKPFAGDADKEGCDSTTHVVDVEETIFSSPRTKDRAGPSGRAANMELILKLFQGEEKMLVSGTDDNLGALQAAAPTLACLSVSLPTPTVLRAVHAMPRLKRLRVYGGSQDFCSPNADVGDHLSPALPDAPPATLRWLEVESPRPALLRFLLPPYRLTLQVLRLDSQGCESARMSCYHLFSLLEQCDFQVLRRLELNDMLAHSPADDLWRRKQDCTRQLDTLLPVLPAGVRVLCGHCQWWLLEEEWDDSFVSAPPTPPNTGNPPGSFSGRGRGVPDMCGPSHHFRCTCKPRD